MDIPEYAVELWDLNGIALADVSHIITNDVTFVEKLNDVEDITFGLDLVQFELLCASIGTPPRNILEPYITEVRIKRNGVYRVGGQVVDITVNINADSPSTIQVQCTGYLNYFKDRYNSSAFSGVTYAQIAAGLITQTQAQTNGNFGVTLGIDTASPTQQNDRVRNYDNQEIKDGIINLTKLENDNFDFAFTADKVFNMYAQKGSMKPEIIMAYPQNIQSMGWSRDASSLANKIIAIGSGIGDERIETTALDTNSSITYKVRERVETYNSVENMPTLVANAGGTLADYKDVLEVPTLNLEPGTINLDDIETGDIVTLRVLTHSFLEVDDLFRIHEIGVGYSKDGEESISLRGLLWES